MSGLGMRQQHAKTFRSGHCNRGADHQQCEHVYQGLTCICACHGAGTPGLHSDIPEDVYHADQKSLSVSGAKTLLKAPALFRWQQEHPERKDVFDFGSAAHELVLGIGIGIAIIPPTSRAKADQEAHKAAQEAARAEGKTPLTADDYEIVQAMADVLYQHRLAMRLLSDGKPEVSAYAPDEATGVMRRARFDWLGATILTDYKTTRSSQPASFVKDAANFGYHLQAAWYTDLARDLGHPAEAFAFIAQEKTPPYLVTVIELPVDLVDVGRARNHRALERFRDCTAADIWPGYLPDDQFATPTAPRWALYNDEESA